MQGAEQEVLSAAGGRERVLALGDLVVGEHLEQPAVYADEEIPAGLALLVLLGPAARLQAVPRGVGEGRAHEAVQVCVRIRDGGVEPVAQELAHAE